jgi:hypothetical protein
MRIASAARALTVLLLSAPLALTAAPSATADVLIPTHVDIHSVGVGALTYGTDFFIRGQVIYTDPEDGEEYAAGGDVSLDIRDAGSDVWSPAGTDHMSVFYPVFDFDAVATRNRDYRVTFAGDETYAPSVGTLTVKVARKVTAKMTEPRDNVWYLSGRVAPTYVGQPVVLMRKKCSSCSWRAYATKYTNEFSHYKFRLPLPPSGSYYFRARVPADASFVTSYSGTYQLTRLF